MCEVIQRRRSTQIKIYIVFAETVGSCEKQNCEYERHNEYGFECDKWFLEKACCRCHVKGKIIK